MSFFRSIATLGCSCLAVLVSAAPAVAGTANAGLSGVRPENPLAGLPMGTFHSSTRNPTTDPPSAYYNTAKNPADRADFAKVVATPRFRWFGSWIPLHDRGRGSSLKWGAYRTARSYIRTVQAGDRDTLVPIGIFRLEPFERAVVTRLPSRREQAGYRAWIREFARGIRSAHARVALLLQPDMPLALKLPGRSRIDLDLIRWSARMFDAAPLTTVYIDAGASDWEKPATMSSMLRHAGIEHARGFALDLTHYSSTRANVAYGAKIVRDLAHHGVANKHFVVATGMNGRPFTFQTHTRAFRAGRLCPTRTSHHCVTLGHPPTTDTGAPGADAFLWLSRPWYNNATIRTYSEMLQMIRTSPFF